MTNAERHMMTKRANVTDRKLRTKAIDDTLRYDRARENAYANMGRIAEQLSLPNCKLTIEDARMHEVTTPSGAFVALRVGIPVRQGEQATRTFRSHTLSSVLLDGQGHILAYIMMRGEETDPHLCSHDVCESHWCVVGTFEDANASIEMPAILAKLINALD